LAPAFYFLACAGVFVATLLAVLRKHVPFLYCGAAGCRGLFVEGIFSRFMAQIMLGMFLWSLSDKRSDD
jgi:hypothetical protein